MKIDIPAGGSIYTAVQFAIKKAYDLGCDVQFKFNGTDLSVSQFSYDVDIATIYGLKCEVRRLQNA